MSDEYKSKAFPEGEYFARLKYKAEYNCTKFTSQWSDHVSFKCIGVEQRNFVMFNTSSNIYSKSLNNEYQTIQLSIKPILSLSYGISQLNLEIIEIGGVDPNTNNITDYYPSHMICTNYLNQYGPTMLVNNGHIRTMKFGEGIIGETTYYARDKVSGRRFYGKLRFHYFNNVQRLQVHKTTEGIFNIDGDQTPGISLMHLDDGMINNMIESFNAVVWVDSATAQKEYLYSNDNFSHCSYHTGLDTLWSIRYKGGRCPSKPNNLNVLGAYGHLYDDTPTKFNHIGYCKAVMAIDNVSRLHVNFTGITGVSALTNPHVVISYGLKIKDSCVNLAYNQPFYPYNDGEEYHGLFGNSLLPDGTRGIRCAVIAEYVR